MDSNTPLSIRNLANYFREHDPNSGITESAIRRLIKAGAIRSCKVGVKNMSTPAAVLEYYSGKTNETAESKPENGIRRLPNVISSTTRNF